MNKGWREVSQDEFFSALGGLDVHPHHTGPWPYTAEFRTPSRLVRGKAVQYMPQGEGLPKTRYLLPEE